MDFRNELRKLLHKMMLKELSKSQAVVDKEFEDSYYGKKVSTEYFNYNLIEFDKQEYEMGLEFTKLLLQHMDEVTLQDLTSLPNAAVVYAKYLLCQFGLSYPVCFDFDNSGIKYYDQETIDNKNSELFDKLDKLFDEGKINKFEKARLVKAIEFLYDEDMLHKEYYQSSKYTRKRTNN